MEECTPRMREREREREGFSVSSIKFRTECGTTFHAYSLDTLWSTRQKQNCVSERVSEFGFTPRDTDCDDERWKGVGEEEEGGSLSPTSKSDKKVWKANAGRNNNIGTLEWLSDRQSVESMPFPGIENSFGRLLKIWISYFWNLLVKVSKLFGNFWGHFKKLSLFK